MYCSISKNKAKVRHFGLIEKPYKGRFKHVLARPWYRKKPRSVKFLPTPTLNHVTRDIPTFVILARLSNSALSSLLSHFRSDNKYPAIDYQNISYYSEPKNKPKKQSLEEVDPELLKTFDKLGIPLNEQKKLSNVAVDAVFDSVSIATTFREDLAKHGVVFCIISEAVEKYPDLVRKYMGSVVRLQEN